MTPPSEHNRSRRIATGPVMAGDTQQSVEALRIGPRLREARLRRKFSLDQLAKNTGLTKGFISQLERDMTSASVASLVRLCEALQISVGSLFQAPRTLLTTAAEAPAINFGGSGLKEQLLSPRDNALQVIRSEIAPGGGSGEEPYSLDADAEVVHVLRRTPGRGRLYLAGRGHFELLTPPTTLLLQPLPAGHRRGVVGAHPLALVITAVLITAARVAAESNLR